METLLAIGLIIVGIILCVEAFSAARDSAGSDTPDDQTQKTETDHADLAEDP